MLRHGTCGNVNEGRRGNGSDRRGEENSVGMGRVMKMRTGKAWE